MFYVSGQRSAVANFCRGRFLEPEAMGFKL